jgi:hypothetical protein
MGYKARSKTELTSQTDQLILTRLESDDSVGRKNSVIEILTP